MMDLLVIQARVGRRWHEAAKPRRPAGTAGEPVEAKEGAEQGSRGEASRSQAASGNVMTALSSSRWKSR